MGTDLLGIVDIGKTHTRFFVADPHDARIVFEAQQPSRAIDGALTRELDIRGIETWLLDTIARCPEKTRIGALVPIAHGAAAVLVDDMGRQLTAPDYEDARFDEVAETYRPLRDPFELSYSPHLPLGLNLGRQLHYLQLRHTAFFARARNLLLYPQYWAWRLSGVAASEVTSLGCHSDLWRPMQATPTALANEQGWTKLLPPLRAAGDTLGPITPAVAQATGLSPGCRVLCGIHDSNASFLSHLYRRADRPFAVVSSGTWTVVLARGVDLARVRESRDMLVNVDALGAPVATARFMGGREYEVIAGQTGTHFMPTDAALTSLISKEAYAIPSFASSGGPFAGTPGKLINAEALSHVERATLATLYVALMTDHLLTALDVRSEVIIDGPLARNPGHCSLLAALRPHNTISVSNATTSTAIAAAYLAIGTAPEQTYTPVTAHPSAAAVCDYRSRWHDLLEGKP